MKKCLRVVLIVALILAIAATFSACAFFNNSNQKKKTQNKDSDNSSLDTDIGNNDDIDELETDGADDDIIIDDGDDTQIKTNVRTPYQMGTLRIDYISVGQGDGMFIIFPDGKTMIIDGGATTLLPSSVAKTIKNVLKFYGIKEIDYLMLTHPDLDHCNALDDILKDFKIKEFYIPKLLPSYGMSKASSLYGYIDTKTYYKFYEQMELQLENGAELNYNTDTFSITGDDYSFDFYCFDGDYYNTINSKSSGDKKNSISPLGFLNYNERRYAFTGDANDITEEYFINNFVTEENKEEFDCDVLKVGHHGSKTSTTAEFLEIIKPEISIISVGTNVYGHPTAPVLERLQAVGSVIYTTKDSGTISITQTENIIVLLPAIGEEFTITFTAVTLYIYPNREEI